MTDMQIARLERARTRFDKLGIKYQIFNNGYHFKVQEIDYWPTRDKWQEPETKEIILGLDKLIEYLKPKDITKLTVEQMFTIAKKVYPMNLEKICEALHNAIYKKETTNERTSIKK